MADCWVVRAIGLLNYWSVGHVSGSTPLAERLGGKPRVKSNGKGEGKRSRAGAQGGKGKGSRARTRAQARAGAGAGAGAGGAAPLCKHCPHGRLGRVLRWCASCLVGPRRDSPWGISHLALWAV